MCERRTGNVEKEQASATTNLRQHSLPSAGHRRSTGHRKAPRRRGDPEEVRPFPLDRFPPDLTLDLTQVLIQDLIRGPLTMTARPRLAMTSSGPTIGLRPGRVPCNRGHVFLLRLIGKMCYGFYVSRKRGRTSGHGRRERDADPAAERIRKIWPGGARGAHPRAAP